MIAPCPVRSTPKITSKPGGWWNTSRTPGYGQFGSLFGTRSASRSSPVRPGTTNSPQKASEAASMTSLLSTTVDDTARVNAMSANVAGRYYAYTTWRTRWPGLLHHGRAVLVRGQDLDLLGGALEPHAKLHGAGASFEPERIAAFGWRTKEGRSRNPPVIWLIATDLFAIRMITPTCRRARVCTGYWWRPSQPHYA